MYRICIVKLPGLVIVMLLGMFWDNYKVCSRHVTCDGYVTTTGNPKLHVGGTDTALVSAIFTPQDIASMRQISFQKRLRVFVRKPVVTKSNGF